MCLIWPTFLLLDRFRPFFSPVHTVNKSPDSRLSDRADNKAQWLAQWQLTPIHVGTLCPCLPASAEEHTLQSALFAEYIRAMFQQQVDRKAARLSLRVYAAYEKVFQQGIRECFPSWRGG